MSRRPKGRALIAALIAVILMFAGGTGQAAWLYVLAAGVLGLIAGSSLVRHGLSGCRLVRTLPSTIRLGERVPVRLAVVNSERRNLPLFRVEDRFLAFSPEVLACEGLPAGDEGTVETVRRARRRGLFDSGEVVLTSGWPFGLFGSQRTLDVPSRVVVTPRWVELSSFPILEPSSFPLEHLHERARTGAGLEYLGVREYRAGDPARSVHWRSSARAGRLVVREYEEEVQRRVALVLAGRDDGVPPDSSFEALTSAAASVARYALVTGHPVDLVRASGSGAERIGDPDTFAALAWLATAEAVDAPLAKLLAVALERTGRRGTVVLLAPAAGRAGADLVEAAGAVQAAGARALAVVARSSTWAGAGSSSRDENALLAALRRRATVRVLAQGRDLRACLEG